MAKKRHPDDYRQAMRWRDAGSTYREIGENFGVGPSMARIMVYRGERMIGRLKHPEPWRPQSRRRSPYGKGDLTWQWRDWNEWIATPMIGRSDDNTAGWSNLSAPPAPNEHFAPPPVDWVFPCPA